MVIENEPDKYLYHINGYGNTQDEVKLDEFLIKNRKYMEDLITTVSISKYNQNPMSTKYYLFFVMTPIMKTNHLFPVLYFVCLQLSK